MGNISGDRLSFLKDLAPKAQAPEASVPPSTFDAAIEFVLKNEGGFSWNVHDHGSATNHGITIHTLAVWRKRAVTVEDVRNMSVEEAKAIYKSQYWTPGLERVPQPIATAVLDWSVLHGPVAARMEAQRTANNLGCHLLVDGQIGPASVAGLNTVHTAAFCQSYSNAIKRTFDSIIDRDPSQAVFRAGWYARANKIAKLA